MPNDQDDSSKKSKKSTLEKVKETGDVVSNLGKTIETLFGPATGAAPTMVPSTVRTGPPQVTGGGGQPQPGFSTAGAGGGPLPAAPAGVGAPQMAQMFPFGTTAPTPESKGPINIANAMSSVFGTIHEIASNKKQEKIQHAQFLYNLVKTSYEQGDDKTANVILQDDKNRKLIEEYLTGKLPRVPGQPTRESPLLTPGGEQRGSVTMPAPKGGIGDINKPGGPAMPRAGAQSQIAAAVQNMILEGLKKGDPRITEKVLGEGTASLSQEQYTQAMRSKFGIELAPAQVEAMDKQAQLALAETKADVLKYLVGQQAASERAISVAKIHAGATTESALIDERARLEVARLHRDLLVKLKGTTPDKMEQVMYKSLADLYSKMAQNSLSSSGKLAKDSPKQAKQYEDEAKQWALKAEQMKSNYEAGQFLDKLLSDEKDTGGTGKGDDVTIMEKTEKPLREENDDND